MRKKIEMKYDGYCIKKLIEETVKEGFKEESCRKPRPSIRKFTKWVNGIAHKLRWIEIPQGGLFIPACPEKKRKFAEKKQAEERKRLQLVTEAKRGINWDESIIEYNDERFDEMINELQKLCNEVSKQEKNLEQRWDVMKHKLHNIAKNNLEKKHAPSEMLKQLESEKDVPLYLSNTLTLEWKDPVCGEMVEEMEAMQETFYNKYRDFISSITLDAPEAFTYLTRPVSKGRFEHNRFIIEGCRTKKQLNKLLRFVKLYNKAFGVGPERRASGRPGYSPADEIMVLQVFEKFKRKFQRIQTDIRKERRLLPKSCLDISKRKKSGIARKHGVGFEIVEAISKKGGGAYKKALENTAIHFEKRKSFLGKVIPKYQIFKMIRSKSYKNRFEFSD